MADHVRPQVPQLLFTRYAKGWINPIPLRGDQKDVFEGFLATYTIEDVESVGRGATVADAVDRVNVDEAFQLYAETVLGAKDFGNFNQEFTVHTVGLIKTWCVDQDHFAATDRNWYQLASL
jgi:hypothetical protein